MGVCHIPVGGEQREGWSSGQLFNLHSIYPMRGQKEFYTRRILCGNGMKEDIDQCYRPHGNVP